jgi:hypothetical protein
MAPPKFKGFGKKGGGGLFVRFLASFDPIYLAVGPKSEQVGFGEGKEEKRKNRAYKGYSFIPI